MEGQRCIGGLPNLDAGRFGNSKMPGRKGVADSLDDWANRRYTDEWPTRSVEKRFGLSRATTLLHFLSGGCFPIFDSRVRRAMTRLLSPNSTRVENTVRWYLDSYCSLFAELAALCGAEDFCTMDKALFSYGARTRSSALTARLQFPWVTSPVPFDTSLLSSTRESRAFPLSRDEIHY